MESPPAPPARPRAVGLGLAAGALLGLALGGWQARVDLQRGLDHVEAQRWLEVGLDRLVALTLGPTVGGLTRWVYAGAAVGLIAGWLLRLPGGRRGAWVLRASGASVLPADDADPLLRRTLVYAPSCTNVLLSKGPANKRHSQSLLSDAARR